MYVYGVKKTQPRIKNKRHILEISPNFYPDIGHHLEVSLGFIQDDWVKLQVYLVNNIDKIV